MQMKVGMYRSLLLSVLAALVSTAVAYAQAGDMTCRELLKNEADLEKLYELSTLVFMAEIEPRGGVNRQIYNYRVFEPLLKGTVPATGVITFADGCSPRATGAIYLFFLDSIKEKIAGFNAIFFSLPDGGPGYTWIADWIEMKMGNNMKSGDGSQEPDVSGRNTEGQAAPNPAPGS